MPRKPKAETSTKQKSKQPAERTIYEIRKEQANKALKLAKPLDDAIFIGELNDDKYYLVIAKTYLTRDIQAVLSQNDIQTKFEHRVMANDDVLYLLDDKPKTPKAEEEDADETTD